MRRNALLTKIASFPDAQVDPEHPLRTETVSGFFIVPPQVDRSFLMIGAPLSVAADEDAHRRLTTSKVVDVTPDGNGGFYFNTLNSRYHLSNVTEVED